MAKTSKKSSQKKPVKPAESPPDLIINPEKLPADFKICDPRLRYPNPRMYSVQLQVGKKNPGNVVAEVYLGGRGGTDATPHGVKALAQLFAAAPALVQFAILVLKGCKNGAIKSAPLVSMDPEAENWEPYSLASKAEEVIREALALIPPDVPVEPALPGEKES